MAVIKRHCTELRLTSRTEITSRPGIWWLTPEAVVSPRERRLVSMLWPRTGACRASTPLCRLPLGTSRLHGLDMHMVESLALMYAEMPGVTGVRDVHSFSPLSQRVTRRHSHCPRMSDQSQRGLVRHSSTREQSLTKWASARPFTRTIGQP